MTDTKAKLFDQLRRRSILYRAWGHVSEKAKKSSSADTRNEAHRFAAHHVRNIERIADSLRQGKFRFMPSRGILITKKGKASKRPVVVAPIESRIVQRALLDLVQDQPLIRSQLTAGFNFGGVEGPDFGVPKAVQRAQVAASENQYYIRTDIKSFFTKVPRAAALQKVLTHIDDERFRSCLVAATNTELDDVQKYGVDAQLFPLFEEGVAQGSCLSPLLCNLLLTDFDSLMNKRGIVCIRYIDDFILFAKSKRAAFGALRAGQMNLKSLGLDVYDPISSESGEREKADHGLVVDGFTFLGCDVKGERVRPSKKNRDRLKARIKEVFDSTLGVLSKPKEAAINRNTFSDALRAASLVIRGWGNTHFFCTDAALMRSLDEELGMLFEAFSASVKRRVERLDPKDRRRVLGLFLLEDCNTR